MVEKPSIYRGNRTYFIENDQPGLQFELHMIQSLLKVCREYILVVMGLICKAQLSISGPMPLSICNPQQAGKR